MSISAGPRGGTAARFRRALQGLLASLAGAIVRLGWWSRFGRHSTTPRAIPSKAGAIAALYLASLSMACSTGIKEATLTDSAKGDFIHALVAGQLRKERADSLRPFDQLVGSWRWSGKDYGADGSETVTTGRWIFAPVLNDTAIQDVFIFDNPHAGEAQSAYAEYGTTLRFPDGVGGSWKCVWVGPMNGVARVLEANASGSEIVVSGKNGNGQAIRWIFSGISQDSFHWRGEYSADGGRRWILYEDLTAVRQR